MADHGPTRKLAAILHADVVGYSRMMGEDEIATHRIVRYHCDRIGDKVRAFRGQVVHCVGDSVLADFATVTDALAIRDGTDSAEGSCPATALKVLAARVGFETLLRPEMVDVPAGSFMMGADPG